MRREQAHPTRVRRDAKTRAVFGGPRSPRQAVAEIIAQIRRRGDAGLAAWTRRLEGWSPPPGGHAVSQARLRGARRRIPDSLRGDLERCAANIRAFHRAQLPLRRAQRLRPGVRVEERILPLDRVGVYVPGGRAPLVSTVLMNALPAAAAGVEDIVMATPPTSDGDVPDAVLAAASIAGVRTVYRMGGAAAVAALAYGTPSIPRVDKIVGPGNVFVTEAKRQVFGDVGIDSLAGPSEILILADAAADPEVVAWDLLAQGEHGSGATALLMSPSSTLLDHVEAAARSLARAHPVLQGAVRACALVRVRSLGEGARLAEDYAPEHLSLQIASPRVWLARIRHAGAAFLGTETPQAMGDYAAGTNHVLPTGGTARWWSPLSARDFVRITGVVRYTTRGVRAEGAAAAGVAAAEGLTAHGESIRVRLREDRRRR